MRDESIKTKWVTIAVAYQLQEAFMLKAILEDNGFLVFLKDESMAQVYTNAVGGFKIQVPDVEAEKAYKLLLDGGYIS